MGFSFDKLLALAVPVYGAARALGAPSITGDQEKVDNWDKRAEMLSPAYMLYRGLGGGSFFGEESPPNPPTTEPEPQRPSQNQPGNPNQPAPRNPGNPPLQTVV